MAFPEDPLGTTVELGIDGVLTDVTQHALTRDIITHTRGQNGERPEANPASCSLTLKSPDGLYSPRNPRSPYFEKIGLNTPTRVSVFTSDRYLWLPDTAGNGATTPDHASLDITGDIDIRIDLTLDPWHGISNLRELAGKYAGTGNQRSWALFMWTDDRLVWRSSPDGTNVIQYLSTTVPFPASRRLAVRATLDVNNGAGGHTLTWYTAPTIAGPWTMLGTPDVHAGTTSVFSSTAPLIVGDVTELGFERPVGRAHAFELRSGIGGTVVANPDFSVPAEGAASFVDGAGRTWTPLGDAEITNRQIRFVGEFSDWPAEWSGRGDLITVEGEAVGILERMNQGTKTLASTLRRRIPSYSPLAYWPLEEGSEATTAFSPLSNVRAFTPTGFDFAGDDSLPGSSPLPVIQVGASFVAPVPVAAAGTWQVELVYNLDAMPVAQTTLFEVRTTGTARKVRVRVATNQVWIEGLDSDDASVFSQTSTAPNFTGAWNRLQIKAVQSGGNVQYVLNWITIGGGGLSVSTTIAAVPGYVTEVRSSFGTGLDGMRFGHLTVLTEDNNDVFNSADRGFTGETAGARMVRLCAEEGVPFRLAGEASDTIQLGPQRPGTLLKLLQECADTDGGIFGEEHDRLGLRYRPRVTLYNQTPTLTLQYGAKGVARPLRPVDDTSTVRNDITVNRIAGGSGRAVLEEGRLSVQDPPDGVGLYDEAVDLNLYTDDQAEPVAFWRLHLGTWDEARYPVVTVKLHKAPQLIATVLDITEGDMLRITDLPDFLPPGPVDLLVQGYTERIGIRTWEIDFVCIPAGPWRVGEVEDPAQAWADTDGSELATDATATATTLDILTTTGLVWKPDPAETPFELTVGGEEVRVTAGGRLVNTNPFFDTSVTGWSGSSTTVAWSTDIVHPGANGSMFVTPAGGVAAVTARSDLTAVGSITPGTQHKVSGWFYSPGGWSALFPSVQWADAAGTILSSSGVSQAVPSGVWTYLEDTVTAPASASRARMTARAEGTPAASDVFYAWAVRITQVKASWLYDTFTRTLTNSWGTADSGNAWSNVGGGSATDYTTSGTYGAHVLATVDTTRRSGMTAPSADFDIYCDLTTSALATGDSLFGAIAARMVDASNLYMARLEWTTGNAVILSIRKIVAGVQTQLGTYTLTGVTHVAGTFIRVRFQGTGTALTAKVWRVTDPEPDAWRIEVTDSALTAAQQIGTRSIRVTGNTNAASVEVRYDNYEVINPQVMSVDRSHNGVVKAQTAGTDVRLAYPTVVAL